MCVCVCVCVRERDRQREREREKENPSWSLLDDWVKFQLNVSMLTSLCLSCDHYWLLIGCT